MPPIRRPGCIALFLALASTAPSQQQPVRQQTPIHLRTRDVTLQFAAGESVPRLVALTVPRHQPWRNRLPERLPDHVEIAEKSVPLSWKLVPSGTSVTPTEVAFVYESASPHVRLTWQWQARANFGPIEHQIRVENLGDKEVWLPFQDSFQFDFAVNGDAPLKHFFVEKGADAPSAIGTHDVAMQDGYAWEGNSSTYAHPARGEAREIIPWFLVQRVNSSQDGWYVGIEFSGRTRLALVRKTNSLHGAAGLNPWPGPFRTRLPAGESFVTPKIFLGGHRGGPDGAGNVLRRWVREVLTNPATWGNPNYPFLVNNSWGSGMAVDEALAHRMIEDSAELQLEMFHIDAGWFGGVGDWHPNTEKFPHGLAAIADEAHRRGLKFGLWVDWSQAALSKAPGALNLREAKVRDWLVADVPVDWKPGEFKGQTIDIGVPAAKDWAQEEVNRIVDDYHLDMIEHDGYLVAQGCDRPNHPHAPPDPARTKIRFDSGACFVLGPNSTDVSYHAVRAYYAIHANLRKSHPGLLFEICNDGGRMVDFGSAAHGDYFSITDAYDPLSNRRAFYDTSFVLPPAMLETYVEKWPAPSIESFRYMLRSGMMGWLSIMQDTTAWTASQHQAAQREFALYKSRLRPLIRAASLFHVAQRPDGVRWDAIEYFDRQNGKGVVYAFRGSAPDDPSHSFPLRGLRASSTYKLEFADGSSPAGSATGRQLMSTGLRVTLKSPLTSELVFIEESPASSVETGKK